MKIIQVNPGIADLVAANDGYCPCHCGRYEKVDV